MQPVDYLWYCGATVTQSCRSRVSCGWALERRVCRCMECQIRVLIDRLIRFLLILSKTIPNDNLVVLAHHFPPRRMSGDDTSLSLGEMDGYCAAAPGAPVSSHAAHSTERDSMAAHCRLMASAQTNAAPNQR